MCYLIEKEIALIKENILYYKKKIKDLEEQLYLYE